MKLMQKLRIAHLFTNSPQRGQNISEVEFASRYTLFNIYRHVISKDNVIGVNR